MLGLSDLKQVIERLIGDQNRLPESDMKFLIQVSLFFDVSLSEPYELLDITTASKMSYSKF